VGVYQAARTKLLIDFDLVGLVELRDKTFSATNTTTVGVFLRKRQRKELREALTVVYTHFFKGKKNPAVLRALDALKEHSPDAQVSDGEVKAYFQENHITVSTIANMDLEPGSLPYSVALLMIFLLNRESNTVIAYSGEKKEQEDFLGYRFSSSRGREGIELLFENGVLKTALYDPRNPSNPEKVNAHIKMNFMGKKIPIPEVLKSRVRHMPTLQLVEVETFQLKNPSGFFESEHLLITSHSRFGDVIDQFQQKAYQLANLIAKNDVVAIDGLIYNKSEDEVPRKTKNRVLTASNLDLKTARLDMTPKLIHLREDFALPQAMKPRKGDIIISRASGSLKHLGKCVYVEEDVDAVVGGFLSVLRPKDQKLGKALFYRLLSAKFRQYIASLRDQNINNMSISDLGKFPLTLPADLNAFFKMISDREEQLRGVEKQMRELEGKEVFPV
jgi:hypothetical protein